MTATATPVTVTATTRLARAEDNARRCELFANVSMNSDIGLSVRRDPDFDALYRLQTDRWDSWVVEIDDMLHGMGTVLVRDGYLGGIREPVGYLGDLRFTPQAEGRHLLNRFYAPILEQASARYDCDLFLTTIIASNDRARRALTRDTRRSIRRPRYIPLCNFSIRSTHLALPNWFSRSRVKTRRATENDLPAIAGLLDADARKRPFGYPFDMAELQRRIDQWPGLEVSSFYLAEVGSQLVGCVAPWDAAPVKRMVVTEYRGSMLRTKRWYDRLSKVGGFSRLPDRGEAFRYLYLTHQAIPTEDPAIMRALLGHVYRDNRGTGRHFLSSCVLENDPLAPAYRGFFHTDLAATLYLVARPGVVIPDQCYAAGRPGFEMALV